MWPNPQEAADLVTFTEEILNEKLHVFCAVDYPKPAALLYPSWAFDYTLFHQLLAVFTVHSSILYIKGYPHQR